MSRRPDIEIVPIGQVSDDLVRPLLEPLRIRFDRRTGLGPRMPRKSEWYSPDRDQYRTDLILDALVERRSARWLLAVIDADTYAAGLNFVFGQATVGGCCAVIGLARLRPEFHSRPANQPLFHRRILSEAVHELGHVAGLGHCPDPRCVMYFSNTLEDTDRKGTEFCASCRRRVVARAA